MRKEKGGKQKLGYDRCFSRVVELGFHFCYKYGAVTPFKADLNG